MTATRKMVWLVAVSCLFGLGQAAQGQVQQAGYNAPASTDLSTPAMKFFGRGMRTPVTQPRQRRQAPPANQIQVAGGKPFQSINRGPSVTPYLQLDAFEGNTGIPNYYARVLPQVQQQQTTKAQAAQLRQLQQQLRTTRRPGAVATNRNGGVPTTGHSSQFLNNGGYFPSAQR